MTLTHIELFAGISGFGLGFSRSGIQTLAHVEIDPACRALLRRHDPDSIILDDVRTAGAHNLPYADIISFGSPCQDLSVAGKRKGLAGERSGLFHEAIRIVSELRPAFAVWENVPGAFSSNAGRDFAHVLAAFHECGAVDIAWATLDAQHFGVAQRRRRVFVVADFRGERAGEILFIPESGSRNPEARRATWQGTAATTEGSIAKPLLAKSGYRANIGDENYAIVPTTYRMQRSDAYEPATVDATVAARDFKSATDLIAIDLQQVTSAVNRSQPATVAPTLSQSSDVITYAIDQELNPHIERMGALQFSSANGGGKPAVVFNWQNSAARSMSATELVPSLETEKTPAVHYGAGVRRLTPTECERLQGFPDGWTATQPDSTRYRQLGNAVCVNVAAWLGKRIAEAVAASAGSEAA